MLKPICMSMAIDKEHLYKLRSRYYKRILDKILPELEDAAQYGDSAGVLSEELLEIIRKERVMR